MHWNADDTEPLRHDATHNAAVAKLCGTIMSHRAPRSANESRASEASSMHDSPLATSRIHRQRASHHAALATAFVMELRRASCDNRRRIFARLHSSHHDITFARDMRKRTQEVSTPPSMCTHHLLQTSFATGEKNFQEWK
jgi:hypothetical protein